MSQFQSLPFEIIECIVKYSLNTSASSYRSDARVGLSLLHSCRNWRLAFIDAAFDSLDLTSSKNGVQQIRFSKCPSFLQPLEYPLGQHVKTLSIAFWSWGSVLSGKMDAWMKSSGFAKVCLSRLDSFSFNIHCPPRHSNTKLNVTHAKQLIASFFQLLRQMMPSMRNVEFGNIAVGWRVDANLVDLLIKNQVMDLLRGVNSIKIGSYDIPTYLCHRGTYANVHLTALSYSHRFNLDTASFLEILRMNAANIVSVDIDCLPLIFVKDIIKNDDGEPLVYPRLIFLRIAHTYQPTTLLPKFSNEPTDSSLEFNHFPALKTLDLSGGLYPLKHNIFGSGANNTLEVLRLCICKADISQDTFSSLLSIQFVKLKSFALLTSIPTFYEPQTVKFSKTLGNDFAGLLQLILQSSICLTSLTSKFYVRSYLLQLDSLWANTGCLRYLDIEQDTFSFTNILHIIRMAPCLKRLTCRLYSDLPNIEGIEPSELPQHIQALYPISSHFAELRVKSPFPRISNCYIKLVVLLAVGCPNFSTIEFEDKHRKEVRGMIVDLLKTQPYNNYANAAKKLLDKLDSYLNEPLVEEVLFLIFDQ